jgi:hypothetical protein
MQLDIVRLEEAKKINKNVEEILNRECARMAFRA